MPSTKKLTFFLFLSAFIITGCQSSRITKSGEYTGGQKVDNLFVQVVSDAKARGCLYVYKDKMVDSLKRYGIRSEGSFACCRDKKTVILDMLRRSGPVDKNFEFLLAVIVTEVGEDLWGKNSLSRKLQLVLLRHDDQSKPVWQGEMAITFDSFYNTEDYIREANKLVKTTMEELRAKGII